MLIRDVNSVKALGFMAKHLYFRSTVHSIIIIIITILERTKSFHILDSCSLLLLNFVNIFQTICFWKADRKIDMQTDEMTDHQAINKLYNKT